MKDYKRITDNIKSQLNPENILVERYFSSELGTISYSDILVFVRMAMKGVDPEYTQKSREAGDKVKDHLDKQLTNKSFRYQGSIMTDTHVKGYSDVDLLVITDRFYSYDAINVNQVLSNTEIKKKYYQSSINKLEIEKSISSYTGNSNEDLRQLRLDSEKILQPIYTICDITKPKSIKVTNQSLKRNIDVVVANWYDDVTSIINDKGVYRGIQVYDKSLNIKGNPDYPFLSIERINERSSLTNGRIKKMIRFLKNIKGYSEQKIDISSFDINAICFAIDPARYNTLAFYELVQVIYNQLYLICTNHQYANDLTSVDGREYIFRNNQTKLENLRLLMGEVYSILLDLNAVRKPIIYG